MGGGSATLFETKDLGGLDTVDSSVVEPFHFGQAPASQDGGSGSS